MVGELTAWLDAAGRLPLLTAAEEIVLARQIRAARGIDPASQEATDRRLLRRAHRARERMTSANLRLVYRVATSYRGACPDHLFVDLLQVGAEGVMHAANLFDPDRGYKFSTYAAIWIRQRIQIELDRHSRTIRAPTTITPKLRRLPRVRHGLTATLGRPPTVEELAAALDFSVHELETALVRARVPASLDQELGDDDATTLGDLQASLETTFEDEQLTALRQQLARLPRVQRELVSAAYFPGGATVRAVARSHQLSWHAAQTQLAKAIRSLQRLHPNQLPGGAEQLSLSICQPVLPDARQHFRRHYRRRSKKACDGQIELPLRLSRRCHARTLRNSTTTL